MTDRLTDQQIEAYRCAGPEDPIRNMICAQAHKANQLREALEWYATTDNKSSEFLVVDTNGEFICNFAEFGAIARDALAGTPGGER